MSRLSAVLVVALCLSVSGGQAFSQKKPKEVQSEPDPTDGLAAQLRSKDGDAAEAAEKLSALGTSRALNIVLDEMAIGVTPKVAAAALAAIGPKNDAQAVDVLLLYSRDRNPELRKLAVAGLGGIREQRTVAPLIAALSDPTSDVRAAAAHALGERREKSAEPQLLKLLQRKDSFAPAALGQVGGPETARALGEAVGNIPDRLLIETLSAFLQRKDFGPDPLRLEVVKTLGKLPGNEAVDALSDYVKATAKDKALPSRVEAGKIIEQRTAK